MDEEKTEMDEKNMMDAIKKESEKFRAETRNSVGLQVKECMFDGKFYGKLEMLKVMQEAVFPEPGIINRRILYKGQNELVNRRSCRELEIGLYQIKIKEKPILGDVVELAKFSGYDPLTACPIEPKFFKVYDASAICEVKQNGVVLGEMRLHFGGFSDSRESLFPYLVKKDIVGKEISVEVLLNESGKKIITLPRGV